MEQKETKETVKNGAFNLWTETNFNRQKKYLEKLKLNVYKKIGIFEMSNMEQKGTVQKMFWNIKTQISTYFGL